MEMLCRTTKNNQAWFFTTQVRHFIWNLLEENNKSRVEENFYFNYILLAQRIRQKRIFRVINISELDAIPI